MQAAVEGRDESESKPTKRKRNSVSCISCRKSKLRCDTDRPCARCVRQGLGDNCSSWRSLRKTKHSVLRGAAETSDASSDDEWRRLRWSPKSEGSSATTSSWSSSMRTVTRTVSTMESCNHAHPEFSGAPTPTVTLAYDNVASRKQEPCQKTGSWHDFGDDQFPSAATITQHAQLLRGQALEDGCEADDNNCTPSALDKRDGVGDGKTFAAGTADGRDAASSHSEHGMVQYIDGWAVPQTAWLTASADWVTDKWMAIKDL